MTIVELVGPVGAGKSAVAAALPAALRERGVAVSRLDEVAAANRLETWLWNARFALANPRLAWEAARAAVGAPLPWWHRRLILGLVLGVGGKMERARGGPREHVVLVDEGLVHRTVNLFAWYAQPMADAVQRYAERVPTDGIFIYVDARPATARRRALARGLPKRLVGRSPAEVSAFISRARRVVEVAIETSERRGATVIRVANGRSLRRAVNEAADATAALVRGARTEAPTPPAFHPRWPTVARPDRRTGRMVARRSGAIAPAVLEAVIGRYGLARRGRTRTLTAPGARGSTVRVRTSGGGDVVVKRYKNTVEPSAIQIEHAVLQALEHGDIPTPRIRRTDAGFTSVDLDGACFAVYDYIGGYRHPHELVMVPSDRHHLETVAGGLLGMLHRATERLDVPPSSSLGFVRRGGPRVRGVEWFTERLAEAPVPRRVRAWIHGSMWRLWETFAAEDLPITVIHGDYGPYNLLVRPDAVPVIVDWELARLDWRLVDVATALQWFARRRRGWDIGAARRVLAAYRRTTDASQAELERAPEMLAYLALQRAAVAWSRAAEADAGRWDAEARERVLTAEDLLAGRHPVCRAVRAW